MRRDTTRHQAPFLILLALATLAGCGDSGGGPDGGGGGTVPPPTRTPVGTTTGSPTSQNIGPAGGTLTAAGGAVSLTVPAGALAANTDISIQAVTPQAPGAIGSSWRLLPEGVQFSAPVTLTFRYDEEMMKGSAPEISWIAYQEGRGAWRYVDEITLEKGAGTLSVATTHFSDWTLVQGLQLRPPHAEVEPGGSVELEVKNCMTAVEGPLYAYECVTFDFGDEDDLPSLPSRYNPQGTVDVSSWAVNGDAGGSGIYGLVFGAASPGTLGTAEYRAPSEAPEDRNPVAVSVDVRDGGNRRVATLVANILVRGSNPTIHVVGGVDTAFYPIAVLLGADVTDKLEFDMVLKGDGSIDFVNVLNFASTYSNVRLPSGADFCNFTVDSPFEFGTFDEFHGGASSLDSSLVSFAGTTQFAASSYWVEDNEGNCIGPASYPAAQAGSIGSRFDFDRTLFDHVGAQVVVLGTNTDGLTLDGWAFSLRRTR